MNLFQQRSQQNKFILIVDTETSCFPDNGGWLAGDTLSWSGIVTDLDLNILDKKTVKLQPTNRKYWNEGAEKVHGFSYEDALCNHLHPKDGCIEIMKFLKPFKHKDNWPILWIEHSLSWIDFLFTQGLFFKNNLLHKSRMVLAHDFAFRTIPIARKAGFDKNKLNLWADRLGIELEHHNSESDAFACYKVFEYLWRNHNEKFLVDY